MIINVNINDEVSVKLTRHGEQILVRKGRISYDYNYSKKTRVLTEQLWVLMNIFGEDLYLGSENVFEDNIIEI